MPDVLVVQGTDIRNISKGTEQFICLTDIANRFGSSDLINDWLKNKNTLEFLGVWEKLNNDEFDEESFSKLMAGAGVNRFRLSAIAVGLTGSWHRNFCYGRTLRGNLRA